MMSCQLSSETIKFSARRRKISKIRILEEGKRISGEIKSIFDILRASLLRYKIISDRSYKKEKRLKEIL